MTKLNRTYKLFVQDPPVLVTTDFYGNQVPVTEGFLSLTDSYKYVPSTTYLEIDYPLTVEFDIERNTSSSINTGTFSITNLSPKTSSRLAKDFYNIDDISSGKEKRQVFFQAGYEKNLSMCFAGTLMEGFTDRRGTETITHLRAQDGAYEAYNAFTSTTFAPNTTPQSIFDVLLTDLGLKKGAVGNLNQNTPLRAVSFNGNTFELLQDNFDNRVFIDLQTVNLLNPDEVIAGQVPLISSETGLLGVPRRQQTNIVVDMIFEPRIKVGQVVEVKSTIDPRFNGQFKVQGIKHSGMISGAVGGDAKTTLQLFYGSAALGGLKIL